MDMSASSAPSRIFIACTRCKARKRKCDGDRPKCSNCAASNAECTYASVRKQRGPGKKTKNDTSHQGDEGCVATVRSEDPVSSYSSTTPSGCRSLSNYARREPPPPGSRVCEQMQIPLFPEYLLPGTFDSTLATFKQGLHESQMDKKLCPLMPLPMGRRLVQNCLDDIVAPEHAFISLSALLDLLDGQYADNPAEPGEDVARWAVVNAVYAIAVRFKIAPGAEAVLGPVAMSFYRNATMVLDRLILGGSSLVTVQALLAMALFARGIPDSTAFVSLATNACHQLRAFLGARNTSSMSLDSDDEVRVRRVAAVLFDEASSAM